MKKNAVFPLPQSCLLSDACDTSEAAAVAAAVAAAAALATRMGFLYGDPGRKLDFALRRRATATY